MKHAVTILTVFVFAAAANAAVSAHISSAIPTPGLPGYTTYEASVTTTVGVIEGSTVRLHAAANSLNQVMMGGTIYADLNPFFVPPELPSWDTQVPYVTNVDVLSALAYEDTSTLNADWAFIGGASNPNAQPTTPVLQITLSDALGAGTWVEGFALIQGQQYYWMIIPEPASLSLLGLGGLAILRRRKR